MAAVMSTLPEKIRSKIISNNALSINQVASFPSMSIQLYFCYPTGLFPTICKLAIV